MPVRTRLVGTSIRAKRVHARAARLAALVAVLVASLFVLSATAWASKEQSSSAGEYGPMYEHVPYGPKMQQNADIYQSRKPDSPIVILVHGGGWRFLFPLSRFERESRLLQAEGFTVFTVQYQQDNPNRPAFPLEPDDVELAAQWAIANAGEYNGNPHDVVLLGGSAGGQFVNVAAEQLNAEAPGAIKGVVSLSGPTDFRSLVPMIEEGFVENENFITSVYQAVGREEDGASYLYPTEAEEEAYEATWSPALQVNRGVPEMAALQQRKGADPAPTGAADERPPARTRVREHA